MKLQAFRRNKCAPRETFFLLRTITVRHDINLIGWLCAVQIRLLNFNFFFFPAKTKMKNSLGFQDSSNTADVQQLTELTRKQIDKNVIKFKIDEKFKLWCSFLIKVKTERPRKHHQTPDFCLLHLTSSVKVMRKISLTGLCRVKNGNPFVLQLSSVPQHNSKQPK